MRTNTRRLMALIATTALATGVMSLSTVSAFAADTHTVCASGCDFSTIQSAVTAAVAGDTVSIAAGTYTGSVPVSKGILIVGAGNGTDPSTSTIITGTSGTGMTLSGGTAMAPITVSNLRVTGFATGFAAGSYVTLDSVASVGNSSYGISVSNGAIHLNISDSAFDQNKTGFKLGSTASASNITITNTSFDNNTAQGWYSDKNKTSGSTLTNVTITDSSFNGNPDKGFYTEKLEDAVFANVEFNNSGNGRSSQGAGLDLNLKYGDYENILLVGVSAIDSGTSATPNGSGISIAARDDGTYADSPATLTGLDIYNSTVSGAVKGIYVGGDIQGTVDIKGATLAGNGVAIVNETSGTVDATLNWWGVEIPDFSTQVIGLVNTVPWYADAAMTVEGRFSTAGDPVVPASPTHGLFVVVEDGAVHPLIDVDSYMNGDDFTVPGDVTVINSDGVSLWIPAGTTASASGSFDGDFIAVEAVTLTTVSLPGGSSGSVVTAIKVGSDSVSFTLDQAARIFLPGAGGSLVGFTEPGGAFTPITAECAADTEVAGNAAATDCYIAINGGADMVVWTKHFTTFAAYTGGGLAATGSDSSFLLLSGSMLVLLGIVALGFVGFRRFELTRR